MYFQCRLCVRNFSQREPIMLFDIKNQGVLTKIKDVTGLLLDDEEHLPRHICAICQSMLTFASEFRDRCRQVQQDCFKKTRESQERTYLKAEIIGSDEKGKFLQIGKLISLPKPAKAAFIDIHEENPKRKEAENIPPVQTHKAVHPEDSLCDQCGESFKNATNLKMHKLRHSGVRAFACISCGQRFFNAYLLRTHVRVRHLGETPYACQFCERKFWTSAARSYHQRTQHVRDRSSMFNTKTDLNKHKKRHSDQKPLR